MSSKPNGQSPQPSEMSSGDNGNILRASLWMIGAIFAFSLMAIAGRAVSFELDTFEIMMYRSAVGLLIVSVILSVSGRWHQITTKTIGLHMVRNTCHFAGQNLWFYAITVIPLTQVFALEFSSPLWVLILSPLLLGERLTKVRTLSAALGFIGILLVARPSPETINTGTMAAAAAAIWFAGAIITTKQLTRTNTLACILFYMTVIQTVFGVITAGVDGDIALPSHTSAVWLIIIGCSGLVAHFCLTTALSIAPATVIMPVDFARLPLITLIGYLFYNETVDTWVVLGAIVIFGANYLNIWHETRKQVDFTL